MASAATQLPTPGPDENHLTRLPDANYSLASNHFGFPAEGKCTAAAHVAATKEKVCAMAKLSAKMEMMNRRMAKAHSLKAHARDLAAYHTEMRAIQADLIRAEIELQADLAAEGFHGHHHQQHHPKRAFADETNHPDEINHVVHDELHDSEHFYHHRELHTDPHVFEGMELPPLSQPCPSIYRHTTHGVQKMELARSDSEHLREHHHGEQVVAAHAACPTQAHRDAVAQHERLHQNLVHVATTSIMPPPKSAAVQVKSQQGHHHHQQGTAVVQHATPAVTTAVKTVASTPVAPATVYAVQSTAKSYDVPVTVHVQVPTTQAIQAATTGQPELKKRRVVKRSPSRPSHTPWTKEESEAFKKLVATEGPSKWEDKATKLGTGRTPKALHTRWMRDQGRIIDRPRLKVRKKPMNPELKTEGSTQNQDEPQQQQPPPQQQSQPQQQPQQPQQPPQQLEPPPQQSLPQQPQQQLEPPPQQSLPQQLPPPTATAMLASTAAVPAAAATPTATAAPVAVTTAA